VVTYGPEDLERVLRSARPTPRPEFVRELERSLPVRRAEHQRRRLRVAFAGVGLATALAVVAIVAAIAGVLPFSSGSAHRAQAKPDCQRVVVERRERRPYLVVDRNGDIHVRYRVETVPRLVNRCR
jgi:hypothetical protein